MQSPETHRARWGRGSFLPLLVSLALMFFLVALATSHPIILSVCVSVLFFAGAVPIIGNRRLLIIFCATAVVVASVRWLGHVAGSNHPGLVLLSHLLIGGQLAFLAWIVLARVLAGGRVTRNEVLGAVCGYLLLGFLFAFAYAALLDIDSSAIEHSVRGNTLDDLTSIGSGVPELVFYSFTTLTTVGYGDILPRSPLAKSFAMIEAVVGQLYLVLLVARLVGALDSSPENRNQVSARADSNPSDGD